MAAEEGIDDGDRLQAARQEPPLGPGGQGLEALAEALPRALAVLRSALEVDALDQAWSRGSALTPEEALDAAVQG